MTTVYLIRHGETANNKEHRCNGCRSDQPLSERGEQQAAALAAYFDVHPVDTLHVSHLTRAKQTASIAFRTDIEALNVEPDLHEVDLGLWDGMTYADCAAKYPELWYNNGRRTSLAVYPGGESAVGATERICNAFLRIVRAHRGERIAIVAHELILVLLLTHLFGWSLDRKSEMAGICNTGFHLLEIDENAHARMAVWNYDHHLTGDLWNKADYATDTERVATECAAGAKLPL